MMPNGVDVLKLLCPNAEWTIYGNDYDSINWFDKQPAITKAEFEAGFAEVSVANAAKEKAAIAAKQAVEAKLIALGLTADDLKALGL